MTITNCPACGGIHFGAFECPFIKAPCAVCGAETILACSDCAINSGGKVSIHICGKEECRAAHERQHQEKVTLPPVTMDSGNGS